MKTTYFSMSHEGLFTWVSRECEQVSGWKPDEVIGHAFTEFILPEELPVMLANRKNRASGRTIEYFTYIIQKDGVPCRAVVRALDTPENTVGSVTVLQNGVDLGPLSGSISPIIAPQGDF